MDTRRRIVVFFDPDADGGSADYFTRLRYKNDPGVEVVSVMLGHGKADIHRHLVESHVSDGDEVHFYDTTPTDIELNDMFYRGLGEDRRGPLLKIVIRDHHASEVDRVLGFELDQYFKGPELDFKMDASALSAAHMVWEMHATEKGGPLEGHAQPPLLDFIDKIESGNLNTHQEKAIAAKADMFFGYGTSIENVDVLYSMTLEDVEAFGTPILEDQERRVAALRSKFKYAAIDIHPELRNSIVPIVNARLPDYGRPIEGALREKALQNEFGVACAWWEKRDGSAKMSIRSYGTVPPDAIARHLMHIFKATGGGSARWAAIEFESMDGFNSNIHPFNTPQEAKAAVPVIHHSKG